MLAMDKAGKVGRQNRRRRTALVCLNASRLVSLKRSLAQHAHHLHSTSSSHHHCAVPSHAHGRTHHKKTGELRSLLAAVTTRMDKTSGRRTGVSDGRQFSSVRDGDVDGWCRGTWEVVALRGERGEAAGRHGKAEVAFLRCARNTAV